MKGQTTPEQADEMRKEFRSKCNYRRKGKVIERLEEDKWIPQTFPSINAAKRASRGKKIYTY